MSIPYDASRVSLYTPGRADDFFKYGSNQTSSESALCAEMARLAYVKEIDRLKTYLQRANCELIFAEGYGKNGTQAFVAAISPEQDQSVIIVSYRGTESDDPSDLITDVRFLKKEWLNRNGEHIGAVHSGFAEALLEKSTDNKTNILTELAAIIDKFADASSRILLTGHSLGAALATLTAGFIAHTPSPLNLALYTYGSPAVGDGTFATSISSVNHLRYVNCCDLVTRIPPEILGYMHTGTMHYITKDGAIVKIPSKEYIDRDRVIAAAAYIKDKGTVGVRELADHSPINYVSAVSNLRS